ncbi:MAG: NUDIX hydrolase [Microthrixaceae bacterium]|nr:NUDIX hydrolase [Microthrixaceae bacterium]
MHKWSVASAVIETTCVGATCPPDRTGLLLVENERQGGRREWTTPGGVIDSGESAHVGLTREVREETGLIVVAWSGLLYTVAVEAPDLGWDLQVEVHRAEAIEGELTIGEDPDGIVVAADWVEEPGIADLVATAPQWVSEPLIEWSTERFVEPRTFSYVLIGKTFSDFRVERLGS